MSLLMHSTPNLYSAIQPFELESTKLSYKKKSDNAFEIHYHFLPINMKE